MKKLFIFLILLGGNCTEYLSQPKEGTTAAECLLYFNVCNDTFSGREDTCGLLINFCLN